MFPGALPTGVEKQHAIETANIDIGGKERLDLKAQALRRVPIVVIPMGDNVAVRLLTSPVPFGADGLSAMMAQIADSWVNGNKVGDRILAIVEDHKFFVRIILSQKQPDRLRHEAPTVRRWHDARNEWHQTFGIALDWLKSGVPGQQCHLLVVTRAAGPSIGGKSQKGGF